MGALSKVPTIGSLCKLTDVFVGLNRLNTTIFASVFKYLRIKNSFSFSYQFHGRNFLFKLHSSHYFFIVTNMKGQKGSIFPSSFYAEEDTRNMMENVNSSAQSAMNDVNVGGGFKDEVPLPNTTRHH